MAGPTKENHSGENGQENSKSRKGKNGRQKKAGKAEKDYGIYEPINGGFRCRGRGRRDYKRVVPQEVQKDKKRIGEVHVLEDSGQPVVLFTTPTNRIRYSGGPGQMEAGATKGTPLRSVAGIPRHATSRSPRGGKDFPLGSDGILLAPHIPGRSRLHPTLPKVSGGENGVAVSRRHDGTAASGAAIENRSGGCHGTAAKE